MRPLCEEGREAPGPWREIRLATSGRRRRSATALSWLESAALLQGHRQGMGGEHVMDFTLTPLPRRNGSSFYTVGPQVPGVQGTEGPEADPVVRGHGRWVLGRISSVATSSARTVIQRNRLAGVAPLNPSSPVDFAFPVP